MNRAIFVWGCTLFRPDLHWGKRSQLPQISYYLKKIWQIWYWILAFRFNGKILIPSCRPIWNLHSYCTYIILYLIGRDIHWGPCDAHIESKPACAQLWTLVIYCMVCRMGQHCYRQKGWIFLPCERLAGCGVRFETIRVKILLLSSLVHQ